MYKKKYKVSKFEYDYLVAQKKSYSGIAHMNELIEKGYFKSLSDYFDEDEATGMLYIHEDSIYLLLANDYLEVELPIQSERHIVKSFIEIIEHILYVLNNVNDEWDVDLRYNMTYQEIVRKLLLKNTNNAGSNSARAKCEELGFNFSEIVEFGKETNND